MALADAIQVELVLEGEKLLRTDQRITDLILLRDGRLQGSVQQSSDTGAPPLEPEHTCWAHSQSVPKAPRHTLPDRQLICQKRLLQ